MGEFFNQFPEVTLTQHSRIIYFFMKREPLLQQLHAHQPGDEHEAQMQRRIIEFVNHHDLFYSRSLTIGHLTGSAWIVDKDYAHALLTHHGRLNLWVQLGGHVEDDPEMLAAAWREAREESGLADVRPVFDHIFDVDIHAIPANHKEPQHDHYDIRFLFQADRRAELIVSDESKNLAWVALEKISELTQEESVLRMVRKTESLRENTEQTEIKKQTEKS
jgi:8-oxo-dGTP pyrophosphatase MutT (NUDIX family)